MRCGMHGGEYFRSSESVGMEQLEDMLSLLRRLEGVTRFRDVILVQALARLKFISRDHMKSGRHRNNGLVSVNELSLCRKKTFWFSGGSYISRFLHRADHGDRRQVCF